MPIVVTTAEIPAGQSKPIKIKTGPKKIVVVNPYGGTGTVEFFINDLPVYIYYNPMIIEPGGTFNIPDTLNNPNEPTDDNYFCFHNWDEDGKAVVVKVSDVIIP
ncbi:hypothetical protein D9V86_05120 [Bacteroidetes/Chlorobi group bacterium ChocPot_Mid]|jgi:hypothetical protein|nr:MAG: hypothetical protein D9V86_05120 [Bacteroidetes/Chlorobi group bacterium ChocPot_Mid]